VLIVALLFEIPLAVLELDWSYFQAGRDSGDRLFLLCLKLDALLFWKHDSANLRCCRLTSTLPIRQSWSCLQNQPLSVEHQSDDFYKKSPFSQQMNLIIRKFRFFTAGGATEGQLWAASHYQIIGRNPKCGRGRSCKSPAMCGLQFQGFVSKYKKDRARGLLR